MRFFRIYVAVVVVFLFANSAVRAMDLPTYSEESYVFLATDIVEATIGESAAVNKFPVVQATVNKVYKGGHKEGDTLKLTAMDFFTTQDKPDDINSRELAKGDEVLLFLVPARAGFLFDVPEGQDIAMPLPGGLYTIKPDGVHMSCQMSNPGPYGDWGTIGIGGGLAAPFLPHHRTYGSVYGGSVSYTTTAA